MNQSVRTAKMQAHSEQWKMRNIPGWIDDAPIEAEKISVVRKAFAGAICFK